MAKKKCNLKSKSIGTKNCNKTSVRKNIQEVQRIPITRSRSKTEMVQSTNDKKNSKVEKKMPLLELRVTRSKDKENETKKLNVQSQIVIESKSDQVQSSNTKGSKSPKVEISDKKNLMSGTSYVRLTRSKVRSHVLEVVQTESRQSAFPMDLHSRQIDSKTNSILERRCLLAEKVESKCATIANKINFRANEIVFAKMTGYEPWPSRILKISHQSPRVEVYFYGDGRTGTVFKSQLTNFMDNINTLGIGNIPAKKVALIRGIKEALIEYGREHPFENIYY